MGILCWIYYNEHVKKAGKNRTRKLFMYSCQSSTQVNKCKQYVTIYILKGKGQNRYIHCPKMYKISLEGQPRNGCHQLPIRGETTGLEENKKQFSSYILLSLLNFVSVNCHYLFPK